LQYIKKKHRTVKDMTSSFSTISTNTTLYSGELHDHKMYSRQSILQRNSTFSKHDQASLSIQEEERHSGVFSTGRESSGESFISEESSTIQKRRSSQLDNLVRRLSFQELSEANNGVLPLLVSSSSATNTRKFKETALNIRQSLIAAMTIQNAQETNSSSSHLCSGTINGRGSFSNNHALDRQLKFNMSESLEHVLQNSKRLRNFYTFMSKRLCGELIEFWSIIELYQNLYWKPFKLLGANLKFQLKKVSIEPEEEDIQEKNKVSLSNKKSLAKFLSNFTLDEEDLLRNEIIEYYIADNAPSQICLPSQMRNNILKVATTRFQSNLPDRDERLSLFRHAQKEVYDELQRIHLPLFLNYELNELQQNKDRDLKDRDNEQDNVQKNKTIYSPALASMESSLLAADVLSLRRSEQDKSKKYNSGW
jgi:hypothetical protein